MRRKRGDQLDLALNEKAVKSERAADVSQDGNVVAIREFRIRSHTERALEKLRHDGILLSGRNED